MKPIGASVTKQKINKNVSRDSGKFENTSWTGRHLLIRPDKLAVNLVFLFTGANSRVKLGHEPLTGLDRLILGRVLCRAAGRNTLHNGIAVKFKKNERRTK